MIVLTACNKDPLSGSIPFTFTLPDGRTVTSSAVGREIPVILSSFILMLSSDSGNSTDTFTGKIYLKEKREDGQIVIRAKQVVFDVAAGTYRMNGDLEIPLMHFSYIK